MTSCMEIKSLERRQFNVTRQKANLETSRGIKESTGDMGHLMSCKHPAQLPFQELVYSQTHLARNAARVRHVPPLARSQAEMVHQPRESHGGEWHPDITLEATPRL